MRILIFNWKDMSHPAAGGAEVYVGAIARHWAHEGHQVTQFSAMSQGQAPREEVGGVQLIRRGSRFTVYREARKFYHAGGIGRFDVVLDVTNTRPFLCPTYVRDVPVVALIFQVAREVWSYEVPKVAALVGRYWLEPRWLRSYRSIPTLSISESSRESLQAYGIRNVSIVPIGCQAPHCHERLPPKEARPTVCFVGRLAANKRPDHALRAFVRARKHVPDAQMWVIGGGPMEARLRQEFVNDSVSFFGRIADAEKLDLLARCHAVLVTSVREGWGLVVTEAAGVGTAAIGYDVAGLRDSLAASNGVIVKPTVDALAKAVVKLLPGWANYGGPAVSPGGVVPWPDVGNAILKHLEKARDRATT